MLEHQSSWGLQYTGFDNLTVGNWYDLILALDAQVGGGSDSETIGVNICNRWNQHLVTKVTEVDMHLLSDEDAVHYGASFAVNDDLNNILW